MSAANSCCRLRSYNTAFKTSIPIRPKPFSNTVCAFVHRRFFADGQGQLVRDDKPEGRPQHVPGGLAQSSIFNPSASSSTSNRHSIPTSSPASPSEQTRNPSTMAPILDPRPKARQRFERKMVVRELVHRGRISRAAALKLTERQHVQTSAWHRTGMKKVNLLARQIAGKTIDEGIAQMEFSKKRAALWVKLLLEEARSKAIVERGMNLGKTTPNKSSGHTNIELKDGTRHIVKDPTSIYIDQAWVNKGRYTPLVKKRARGKFELQQRPSTNITVLLKEEATRIRLHNEKVEKRQRRKIWEHLPNRPILGQRPYYCW